VNEQNAAKRPRTKEGGGRRRRVAPGLHPG
jgi:hypothetical protein